MDKQIQKVTPNYKRIYTDLIEMKYPEKKPLIIKFLNKKEILAIDVITINRILFKDAQDSISHFNSYSKTDILYFLDYKKKFSLNNSQMSRKFGMSRNTLNKWEKLFIVR